MGSVCEVTEQDMGAMGVPSEAVSLWGSPEDTTPLTLLGAVGPVPGRPVPGHGRP